MSFIYDVNVFLTTIVPEAVFRFAAYEKDTLFGQTAYDIDT